MGNIIVRVTVKNFKDLTATPLAFNATVDTGASHLVLPFAWKPLLGECYRTSLMNISLAHESNSSGEICGSVEIEVDGFRPVMGEVLFIEMQKTRDSSSYEPLF